MATETPDAPLTLDINQKQKVSYCIDYWLRDEQIRSAISRVRGRLGPPCAPRPERIALVGYGPSLNETFELLRDFDIIMSCSGAHKFLIDRGIVPTYHIDVDPRKHKADLIGQPHPDVEYLMASTCHPAVFDLLEGYNVKLWHIFDSAEEGFRILPPGEWALTGGAGAGLRMLAIARCLGFTNQHIFGLDGCEGASGKHAAAHPSQAKKRFTVEYDGATYYTTPAFLECAKAIFHELDAMPDVAATFYGEGLVQHMARKYERTPKEVLPNLAIAKPELISATARELNAKLHRDNLTFGVGGGRHADLVKNLCEALHTTSVLDYGCGKSYLAKALPFPIWEYDPAIPGKDASPRPADIVIATDVLEHVEDGKVQFVLDDIRRCLKQIGYFVIHLGPAAKTYADGRNTHLTQRSQTWWEAKLAKFFTVAKVFRKGPELHVVVSPRAKAVPVQSKPDVSLSLSGLIMRHEPYPIGVATSVLPEALYAELCATFPPLDLFKAFGGENKKWSLSPVNHHDKFEAFIAQSAPWKAFHAYVKTPAFIDMVRSVLQAQGVNVLSGRVGHLSSRFEFSLLPADGGCLRPHTDIASKLVTLVLPMLASGAEWDPSFGGGTDVLVPLDAVVPLVDYQADWQAFETVATCPYAPNQCVVFVKTANSWHGVRPMTGVGSPLFRRTVTINIERMP